MPTNAQIQVYSQTLLDTLRQTGSLTDPRIEAAFAAMPRHYFLPGVPLEQVYSDQAIAIKYDADDTLLSSANQPSMVAAMLRQLQLQPDDNVLEIGTGTGYNAALIQHIVGNGGHVTSLELDTILAKQADINLQQAGVLASSVNVVQSDGAMGYAPRAQYDRIIASVGVWDIPVQWQLQMKADGILVAPILMNGFQVSAAFKQQEDGSLFSADNIPCNFVHMQGMSAGPVSVCRMHSSSVTLLTDHEAGIDTAALHSLLTADHEPGMLAIRLTTSEYIHGLLPHLIIHEPADHVIGLYTTENRQQTYGLHEAGFAIITAGSACFVPYAGSGQVNIFGSADAFLMLEEMMAAWEADGQPGIERLRVRVIPKANGEPADPKGKLYNRREHYLHIWLDEDA